MQLIRCVDKIVTYTSLTYIFIILVFLIFHGVKNNNCICFTNEN